MKRIMLGSFVLISLLHLTSKLVDWAVIDDLSKSLIIPALVGYYLASGGGSKLFVVALMFCWLGDVLLIFNGRPYFLGGLAAFLTGHILYVLTYRQHQNAESSSGLLVPQRIRFSLPIVLAGTGLFIVLMPHLGDLTIPVLFYTIVITVMAMTALFRFDLTNRPSFWLVFVGAVLFMTSDTILALNMLVAPLPMAGFWVMLTYATAQFLIVEGISRHQ